MHTESQMDVPEQVTDEVANYTRFFMELAKPEEIFPVFEATIPEKSQESATVIGSLWYHLSESIVDFLCKALGKLENPYIRHFVVQTAYEELGEDSEQMLHTDLLRQTLSVAGVTDTDILRWSGDMKVKESLEWLHQELDSCQTDAEITGILLGLEIIAYENIQNVLKAICYSDPVTDRVMETDWVRLHNQMEEHHIHRAVSVFVRYVTDLTSQRKFVQRFTQAMVFWQRFWAAVADGAVRECEAKV